MNGDGPGPGSDLGDAVRHEPAAEGTGETVGEAKWAALRELERRFPGLEKADVRFEVLAEGERGLLGVGYAPARVVASVPGGAQPSPPASAPAAGAQEEPGSPPALLREVLERVCAGLGVAASVSIDQSPTGLVGRFAGPDVGLLIGKHGQTIDAIQYVANAVVARAADERIDVVVDAAGYRARRRAAIERLADDAARTALASGGPVALEAMPAGDRKLVHLHLQRRGDVATWSEGAEPNRHVVVSAAPPDAA